MASKAYSATRRLVVTSDDFGVDEAVNTAVAKAHVDGILTAASLMVGAPAAREAVAMAKTLPGLRVGLHLVLVEGQPVLPAREIPALVDAEGLFRTGMAAAGARMFFDPAARAQLAREIEAQFHAFAATGLPLDHVNAHKHFHLHPTIAGLILKIGDEFGLRAARLPLEPPTVLDHVEPERRHPRGWITDPWARLARARFRRRGVLVPDQVFGLAWSGAMTEARLFGLVSNLPPGLSEIYLHPATRAAYPGSAPGYAYEEELAALVAPRVVQAARERTIALGGFSDFLPRADEP